MIFGVDEGADMDELSFFDRRQIARRFETAQRADEAWRPTGHVS